MGMMFYTLPQEVRKLFTTIKDFLNSQRDLNAFGNRVFYELDPSETVIAQVNWKELCKYIEKETLWKIVDMDYNLDQEGNLVYHIIIDTYGFYRLIKESGLK